jgi:pimeloyl-ACP methyl ester carboxylesterase
MTAGVNESMIDVGGVGTFVRRSAGGEGLPTVLVHGNPDSSLQWMPFLTRAEELGGPVIAPDLPGFGRSERPRRERFDCTLFSYERWFRELLDALEIDAYRLVVHDWGALALASAAQEPEQVERLVIVDGVSLQAGYRWHWLARVWRQPLLGELSMLAFGRFTLTQLSRLASPRPGPADPAWIEQVVAHLDRGMKRAILALYRSADPDELERAGRRVSELPFPALVVWGEHDPYVGLAEGERYARILPHARLRMVPGVGHWPLREERAVLDEVIAFLSSAQDPLETTAHLM